MNFDWPPTTEVDWMGKKMVYLGGPPWRFASWEEFTAPVRPAGLPVEITPTDKTVSLQARLPADLVSGQVQGQSGNMPDYLL